MSFAIPFITAAAPYVAVGSSVLSAVGAIRQGQQQSEMYQLQAQQARLKASRDALQYEQQANGVMERLLQTNAVAAAKGFAGGVSGFSGSSKLIAETNLKRGGRDIGVLSENAKAAISYGDIQSQMLTEAADQAITGSYFNALGSLGTAAFAYSKLGLGEVAKTATPDVISVYNAPKGYVA